MPRQRKKRWEGFIVKFPVRSPTYRENRYFDLEEEDLANRWVEKVKEDYHVQGTLIPVKEIKR